MSPYTGQQFDPEEVLPEDLQHLDEAFDRTEAREPLEYERLPDGDYQTKILDVKIRRSRDGLPMMSWFLQLLPNGPKTTKNTTIQESTLGIIKSDLAVLGVNVRPLSAIGPHLEKLKGRLLNIRVKTNTKDGREYSNVYFQAAPGAAPAAGKAEEEPLPF